MAHPQRCGSFSPPQTPGERFAGTVATVEWAPVECRGHSRRKRNKVDEGAGQRTDVTRKADRLMAIPGLLFFAKTCLEANGEISAAKIVRGSELDQIDGGGWEEGCRGLVRTPKSQLLR